MVIFIGELVALSTAFTFGLSNVFFRKVENIYPPLIINLVRSTLGLISFSIIILINNQLPILYSVLLNIITLILLVISGLLGQAIGDTIYFYSQKLVGVSIALPISFSFPVWTSIYAILFLNQFLTFHSVFALLLILIGVVMFSLSDIRSEDEIKDEFGINNKKVSLGIFLAVLSANAWALGAIAADLAFKTISLDSNLANFLRFFPAIILMFFMQKSALGKNNNQELDKSQRFKAINLVYLILGSIIGTIIGAFLFLEGINLLGSAKASIFYATSPLFATPLAVLFLKEKLSVKIILATIIMILGIWILFI